MINILLIRKNQHLHVIREVKENINKNLLLFLEKLLRVTKKTNLYLHVFLNSVFPETIFFS